MKKKEMFMVQVALLLIIISCLVFNLVNRKARQGVEPDSPLLTSILPPGFNRQRFIQEREPEFRGPPYKEYKPPHFQQMGILTNPDDGNILPLYGKTTMAHRDRYNYYTASPGNQMYSLPVQVGDRDCTEDMGCNELYGNEQVAVTGMSNTFSVTTYQNKMFN